jgi:hypothetical protein
MLQPLGVPKSRAAAAVVLAVGAEDLADHLVPGLIGLERRLEELLPFGVVTQPLHEHHVKDLCHPADVIAAGQQLVDQLFALVRRRIG